MCVTKVCIDDFALKKREKYATVMIDIDTHKIIDMIESRELNEVTKWLSTYPNISIFSRDGSITYKNAIFQSHPNAIQVFDRFHILKNLTNYCKEYLKKHLKTKVIIEEKQTVLTFDKNYKDYTLKEKYELVSKSIQVGEIISNACKQYHTNIKTYKKLSQLSEVERVRYFETRYESKESERNDSKMKLAYDVRTSYVIIGSMSKVARIHNLDRKTVKKYLDENFSSVHGSKDVKKKSILDPYKDIIEEYVKLGATSKVIENEIRSKGYIGSSANIRHYLSRRKKTLEATIIGSTITKHEFVEREKLLKLLYNKVDKISGLTQDITMKVYKREPMFEKIITLVEKFRDILKSKKIELLEEWLIVASKLEISELNSFINGLMRDIDAVRNAIKYDYNNGLAEGKINKIKVTKRIMYGRCGFELLKKKLLRLEF